MWTHFWDMHSGGEQKLEWAHIFIEAPQDQAERVFYHRFNRNPNRITCTCCGEDYAISESETLEDITGYHRGCMWDEATNRYLEQPDTRSRSPYIPLNVFLKEIKVIRAGDIEPAETIGDLPEEGYVWR